MYFNLVIVGKKKGGGFIKKINVSKWFLCFGCFRIFIFFIELERRD